jgi:acetoacetate decarboxylase
VVPELMKIIDPVVKYGFIRMPHTTGFGDYTETGQVIPVRFNGRDGNYAYAMYLDAPAPMSVSVRSGVSRRSWRSHPAHRLRSAGRHARLRIDPLR